MTNVSKDSLDPKQKQKLFHQFSSLFVLAGENNMSTIFLELFTESEQIMFIKRVGIIFMLLDEQSNYQIAKTLKVSDSTVRDIKFKYKHGEYDQIVSVMNQKTFDARKFWSVLELVLRAGMPPRGKGRWKYVFDKTGSTA